MAAKPKIKHGNIEYAHTFKSVHKFARLSPFKARYVMDAIRHKPVNEALTLLKYTKRRSVTFVDKVLRSAIANSIDFSERKDIQVPVEKLIIKEALADEGPRIKRWRARSRGIANPIIKRTCHLFIEVGLPKADVKEEDDIEEKIKKSQETLDSLESKLGESEESETEETKTEESEKDSKETEDQEDKPEK